MSAKTPGAPSRTLTSLGSSPHQSLSVHAPPKEKSSNAVTLSAFVQTPIAPAPVIWPSSSSMSWRIDILDRQSMSAQGVIERDVALQRVGSCDVVVIAVLPAPHESAGLIFAPGQRLELHSTNPSAIETAFLTHHGNVSAKASAAAVPITESIRQIVRFIAGLRHTLEATDALFRIAPIAPQSELFVHVLCRGTL